MTPSWWLVDRNQRPNYLSAKIEGEWFCHTRLLLFAGSFLLWEYCIICPLWISRASNLFGLCSSGTSSHLEYMYTVQRWMTGDWWKHLSNELRYYLCLSRVWGKVYQLAQRESILKPSLFCAPEISLIMTGNFIVSWTITNFMSRVLHTTKISNAQMVEEMDRKERL